MKRFTVLLVVIILILTLSVTQGADKFKGLEQSVYSKKSPYVSKVPNFLIEAIWDLQFSFDVQIASVRSIVAWDELGDLSA